jgi:homoserine kinase type II
VFHPLDPAAAEVLHRFPSIRPEGGPLALGNRGGFSGARIWRVEGATGTYCLRAWPPGDLAPERLDWIHQLLRRARSAGLDFVPALSVTDRGTTWIVHAGRLWELATWMPGRADFQDCPASARLNAACTALAHLHGAWFGVSPEFGSCPAIGRRLRIAREWIRLLEIGWHPAFGPDADDPFRSWAERAWDLLRSRIEVVARSLETWTERIVPLQPCLCDIWHDHVLFKGDRVTGLIDYGGVKMDHVAVDLARLLGSMVEDDADQRRAGIQAYGRLRPLSWEEEALVGILDETGTVIAVANWLKWLYRDKRTFEDRAAVAKRLAKLVERIEKWTPVRSP